MNQKKKVVTNGSLVAVGQLTVAIAVLSLLGSTQGFQCCGVGKKRLEWHSAGTTDLSGVQANTEGKQKLQDKLYTLIHSIHWWTTTWDILAHWFSWGSYFFFACIQKIATELLFPVPYVQAADFLGCCWGMHWEPWKTHTNACDTAEGPLERFQRLCRLPEAQKTHFSLYHKSNSLLMA